MAVDFLGKPLALNKKRERTAGPEAFAEDTPKCALKKVNYSLILFELEYLFLIISSKTALSE
jgi:hypothetical protein